MEGPFPGLRELHKKLLQAAPLQEDVEASAALLMPCVPSDPSNIPEAVGPVPSLCAGNVSVTWVPRDVTLLQLSLIQILIIKAENLCTEPQVRCQYARVVELLQQTGLDSTIIGLFNTSDMVLSHISSKCLSYLVLFQLKFQNEVNVPWLQFCLKSLSQDPGSHTLMPCLTSLISACKGILVDERIRNADHLLKILVPLENVFEIFCSTFITCVSATQCQPLALDAESSSQLSCLLDLLEVLVALRIELKLNVYLCKQVLSVILPRALNLISSTVPYFVKKQVILVLKRCLLYKAGEDFLPSAHIMSHQQDAMMEQDMAVLAGALLGSVQEGWLLQVPVSDRSSSFGGACQGSERGPDLVILGAVSLSVLKALEIRFQDEAFSSRLPGHADVAMDLHTFMAHLLAFLKHHLGWKELVHPCEWVSLTFIEQDDDMLEVAKCLLQMYLHNPSLQTCSSATNDDKGIWNWPSHQCGSNPHCIFLFLLNNVLFDSSVLLDFLISSETCFLEYFVRYLKLVKEDWPQFCLTCAFIDKSVSLRSPTLANVFVRPLEEQTEGESQVQGECISLPHLHTSTPMVPSTPASGPKDTSRQSTPSHPSGCESSSLGALQRLVAYDSSEDSESDISEIEHCPIIHSTGADSTDIDKHMQKLGLRARCPVFHSSPASAQAGGDACQATSIQQKSAQCLEDLREAICRLHRKKLFPYNPSALLRLLTHVGTLNKA